MLNISEIFYSLQGESSYSGLPCTFIRLAGCNLRCVYCDSLYSLGTAYTASCKDIVSSLEAYLPVKLVEITGGEPLLQNEVYELIKQLKMKDYRILMETNGSVLLDRVPSYVIKIVDVKCPSSGHAGSFLLNNLEYLDDKDEVKFVIAAKEDYLFAKDFIMTHLINRNTGILISPVFESISPKMLSGWILADKLPVRLQLQLHKIIWGKDTRGV